MPTDGRLRICTFTNVFPPVPSGSSAQAAALCRALTARGHAVEVVTADLGARPTNPDDPDQDATGPIHRLPAVRLPALDIALGFPWLTWTLTPANLRRIDAIVAAFRPDLIHVHNHMF